MLLHHIATAAFGLAITNAFLLVPEVADEAIDSLKAIKALPFDKISVAEERKVDLACPQCPLYPTDHDGKVKLQADKESHLELIFTINHQDAGDRLLVNDFELYPNSDPFSQMLSAELKADFKELGKGLSDDVVGAIHEAYMERIKGKKHHKEAPGNVVPLGFSMLVSPALKSVDGDNMELIGIDLQIIEVANTFLDGIPAVHIDLLKTPENALMIGGVHVVKAEMANPQVGQAKCDTILCKWGAVLDDIFAKIKPLKHCGGKGKGKGLPVPVPTEAEEGEEPKKQHHHHHPGHRVHKHSWGKLFKNIVSHVLLPILVGIVAGVSVSLIGMMVGTCIIALWRLFFRRQHPRLGHAHHRAVQKEAAVAEEKAGLMTEQEAPPAYDEPEVKQ